MGKIDDVVQGGVQPGYDDGGSREEEPKFGGAEEGVSAREPLGAEGDSEAPTGETVLEEVAPPEEVPLEEKLKEEIERLTEERDGYYDRLLRVAAEFDNYKKRMEKERADIIRYANVDLIQELLPVLDNLERALSSAKESHSVESLIQGVEITLKQFLTILGKYGLEKIEAEGQKFDPNVHEAMMVEESEEHGENVIIEELQRGYKIGDRVVRPSLVKVAK
ncbi:MAG: nucleotide exchange factor GrpE [bacterium]